MDEGTADVSGFVCACVCVGRTEEANKLLSYHILLQQKYTHTHTHIHIYVTIYIYCIIYENIYLYTYIYYIWASLVAQMVKNLPAMQETWVQSLVGKIPRRREGQPTPALLLGELHG